MARIRTLKPEILEDEKVSRLTDTAYRLFTSMIVLADDHGRVRADVRWLQAQVWWAHSPPPNVLSALLEIWKAGLVDVYGVRGGTYAALLGWAKHQRVDNAGRGRVPAPDDQDAVEVCAENGAICLTDIARGDSPRDSARRGEIPLDQEGDQEEEGEGDPPRNASSPAPVSRSSLGAQGSGSAVPSAKDVFFPRESERRLASKLGLDADVEAEKFNDYYASKGVRLADKHAGFRGWLRKARKFDSSSEGEPKEAAREARVLDDL